MTREPLVVVGLMSGTSVDGLDAAVVRIRDLEDGAGLGLQMLGYHEQPIEAGLRERIHRLFRPETSRVDDLCEVNVLFGEALAAAAAAALAGAGVQADLVASHGQTVWHEVQPGRTRSTLQIGEPSIIAERLGVTTVADFRPRDIAAGGEGAPLASYVDVLLFGGDSRSRAIQNIGGIGNVTWVPTERDSAVMAFDTGPGNMLIDHAVAILSGGEAVYDRDGERAAGGTPDESLLRELLDHPYFAAPPPKTTGRELFGGQFGDVFLNRARERGLSDVDIIATLTVFTARSIGDQYRRFLPRLPDELVVSGGGALNPTLLRMLRDELPTVQVRLQGEFGMPSTGREAVYFAVLGYQALHGRPNSIPACTGARHSVVMGKIVPGRNFADLMRTALDAPRLDARLLRVEHEATFMSPNSGEALG